MRRAVAGLNFVMLCGGPVRDDGVENFVQKWGANMEVLDTVRSPEHDILDEGRWAAQREKLETGHYAGGWLCPPCDSFCANRGFGPGSRKLRGPRAPELYGLPNLKPHEKETVRVGTCLAKRCAETCNIFHRLGTPFGFEQPKRRQRCSRWMALM